MKVGVVFKGDMAQVESVLNSLRNMATKMDATIKVDERFMPKLKAVVEGVTVEEVERMFRSKGLKPEIVTAELALAERIFNLI